MPSFKEASDSFVRGWIGPITGAYRGVDGFVTTLLETGERMERDEAKAIAALSELSRAVEAHGVAADAAAMETRAFIDALDEPDLERPPDHPNARCAAVPVAELDAVLVGIPGGSTPQGVITSPSMALRTPGDLVTAAMFNDALMENMNAIRPVVPVGRRTGELSISFVASSVQQAFDRMIEQLAERARSGEKVDATPVRSLTTGRRIITE